jgi:tetratricopeptide (TPR) repeat protein
MTGKNLEYLLKNCTLAQLHGIARHLHLKGFSRLSKGSLVSLLIEKVDPDTLKNRLLFLENHLSPVKNHRDVAGFPKVKKMKEKRFNTIGNWASILGFAIGVIALVVTFILSPFSSKQLIDKGNNNQKNYEMEFNKSDREILKEIKRALLELCASSPQEKQQAISDFEKGNMEKPRESINKSISAGCGATPGNFYQLGNTYFFDKKPDYQRALANFLEANRLNPGNGDYLYMIGRVYNELGKYNQALDYIKRSLVIDETEYGKMHPNVARDLNNLGELFRALGEPKKAIPYYERALNIDKVTSGKKHPDVAIDLNNLGEAWRELGDPQKAIFYYNQALSIDEAFYGKEHSNVAIRLNNMGLAYTALNNHYQAISNLKQALSIWEKVYSEQHPYVAIALNNLGAAYAALTNYRIAISYYDQALAIWKKVYGDQHPQVAVGFKNLGSAYMNLNDYPRAISYYEQALAIWKKVYSEQHPKIGIGLNGLGSVYFKMGQKEKAIPYLEKSYAIFKKSYGEQHPNTIAVKNLLKLCR